MNSHAKTNLTRILIVDDHAMVRCALRALIQRRSGFRVIGEVGNSADALAITKQQKPDIILLDIDLGSESGLDLLPQLITAAPEARVIALTGLRDPEVHHGAMLRGAIGLVSKEKSVDTLIRAIEKVRDGEVWLDHSTMSNLLSEMSRPNPAKEDNPEAVLIATLTPKEREIIPLVAEGLRNRQIAQRLHISESTARHHLTAIFSKLSVENRFELIIFAFRHGLVTASERQEATPPPPISRGVAAAAVSARVAGKHGG